MQRVERRAVGGDKTPQAVLLGIDVVELVDDGVELRHPVRRSFRIQHALARTRQRLIGESRQRERDHVVHQLPVDVNLGRLGDEPFRATGDGTGEAVAPEEITRLAGRQAQAVAAGVRAVGTAPTWPPEHEHAAEVDEPHRGDTRDDIVHEPHEVSRVVDAAAPACFKPHVAHRLASPCARKTATPCGILASEKTSD